VTPGGGDDPFGPLGSSPGTLAHLLPLFGPARASAPPAPSVRQLIETKKALVSDLQRLPSELAEIIKCLKSSQNSTEVQNSTEAQALNIASNVQEWEQHLERNTAILNKLKAAAYQEVAATLPGEAQSQIDKLKEYLDVAGTFKEEVARIEAEEKAKQAEERARAQKEKQQSKNKIQNKQRELKTAGWPVQLAKVVATRGEGTHAGIITSNPSEWDVSQAAVFTQDASTAHPWTQVAFNLARRKV